MEVPVGSLKLTEAVSLAGALGLGMGTGAAVPARA
jgi:hypothetical protein